MTNPQNRRDFLKHVTAVGAVSFLAGQTVDGAADAGSRQAGGTGTAEASPASGRTGLLRPQQNQHRNVIDVSGLWEFQLDPNGEGEALAWYKALPAPRPIPVPCSWNDLFDDARDYLGVAWYRRDVFVPPAWRGQRVFIRVGSANYAAKVWVNGTPVAEHLGGHLPFSAEITPHLAWDAPNVIAVTVENRQLPDRVPPGTVPGKPGVMSLMGGHPATTYDFFPYAGIHRPVVLFTVPAAEHIADVTVTTAIEGADGVVGVEVATAGAYRGAGKARLGAIEADLAFSAGVARATIRVPNARFWSPADPHLYPLTVTIGEAPRTRRGGRPAGAAGTTDSYALDVGIRTVEVRGDRLLLNGRPVMLTGFGKHEDFPVNGRGLSLPVWVRDYELLKWIGANSYRTSHYPYCEEAMELADRLGVLVINEIPAVGLSFTDGEDVAARRLDQCLRQIQELVARDKNHPSTIMWSVGNEPSAGSVLGAGPQPAAAVESGTRFFRRMYDETRRLDPTRPVTLVGIGGGPVEWLALFDVVCVNRYYGWYTLGGRLDEAAGVLAGELDDLHAATGKPIVVTEFGADALAGAHNAPAEMWTEEYQVEFLRRSLEVMAARPFVAGTHVWAFADFKTGQGIIRMAGMNFKGVFTRDRRPKTAAHFLRSVWRRE